MKKRSLSILLLLCIFLVGCTSTKTGSTSTKSNRDNPLLPGQTANFDSMDSSDRGFKADITLLDVYRGDVSANYINFSEPPTEDQEVIIAKFNIKLLESVNDLPLSNMSNYFSLVSGESKSYPTSYYYTSTKAKKDILFVDIYPGGEDTSQVLFVVNKDDTDPFIVFNSSSDTPIWFMTNFDENKRLSGENQIVLSDFGIKDGESQEGTAIVGADFTATYGGSLTSPLVVDDWALYEYSSTYNADYTALEVQFLEYAEGKEAEKIAFTSGTPSQYASVTSGTKLVGYKFKMNLLQNDNEYSKELSPTFEIIDTSGKAVSDTSYVYGADAPDQLRPLFVGGSEEGWYFTYIPETLENPRISYKSYNFPSIWFTSDSSASGSEKKYASVYDSSKYTTDSTQELGSFNNPAAVGELVEIDVEKDDKSVAYDMQLASVLTGAEAEKFLNEKGVQGSSYDSYVLDRYQFVVADFSYVVKRTTSDELFNSSTYRFTPIVDYVDYDDVSPSIWSAEGLISEVYPSEETHEGYVVFLVPKDAKELVICFSPLYSETGASYYKYDFDSSTATVKSENSSKETASTKSSEASISDTSSTSESTVSDRFKIV